MRTLVAGIGNVFFGDDAFGVEVAQRLAQRPLPADVRVVDFGVRGFDLALALLDGYDRVLLVDTVARGGTPGTVYLLEPEAVPARAATDAHGLDPAQVLQLVKAWGGRIDHVRVVGCEPRQVDFEGTMSAEIVAAVDSTIELIESLVAHA